MARKTRKRIRTSESVVVPTALNELNNRGGSEQGEQDQLTGTNNRPAEDHWGDRRVIEAVESNTRLLQQLLEQFSCLQAVIATDNPLIEPELESSQVAASNFDPETEQLRDRIYDLENQVAELEQQNSDLASKVASSNVRQAVSTSSSDSSESLSWEDRKRLILEQMEEDVFDAEAFVANMRCESADAPEDPFEFLTRLTDEVQRLRR